MKTFHQFKEDLQQLQRDLYDLERKIRPKQRIKARRKIEQKKAKEASRRFRED